jgi:2-polyprenyl-6-methoxyphenol hydroxylase-like FAD-dependent oxidoreductase
VQAQTIVAGGGIAGLAAALALHRRGLGATVLERRDALDGSERAELIWANGMEALERLGVAETVRAHGRPLEVEEWRSWNGSLLYDVQVGELARAAGRPAPTVVRRRDLIDALSGALPQGTVRPATTVVAADEDAEGVTVLLVGGGEERCDFLLGADGARSRVRTGGLGGPYGETVPGTWLHGLGQPSEGVAEGRTIIALGRADRALVRDLGNGWVGWSAVVDAVPGAAMPTNAELIERFRRFPASIRGAIESTPADAVHRHDVRVVPVQTHRSGTRIGLVGDAAHAFPPSFARGAGEALVDGLTFGELLAEHGPADAAAAFDVARSAAVRAVHAEGQRLDGIFGWRSPVRVRMREQIMKRVLSRKTPQRIAAELREAPV